jgi:peroxiredoxin
MLKTVLVVWALAAAPAGAAEFSLAQVDAPVAADKTLIHALGAGALAPTAPLLDLQGRPYDLAAAIKAGPTVLIFYRGGWCPYCNLQMGQLVQLEPKLNALGVKILAVSPDKPAKMAESVERHKLNYTLLSDSRLELARRFGLAYEVPAATRLNLRLHGIDLQGYSGESHHWLPVPAAYVIDTDGRIRFSFFDLDHTVRIDPDLLYTTVAHIVGNRP